MPDWPVDLSHLGKALSNARYKDDRGDNSAQARYLFYYLQEKGLIRPFVAAFNARGTDDPSGYATLQKILAEPDMQDFQERWVLTLRFGG
jgi:hypothetical protein